MTNTSHNNNRHLQQSRDHVPAKTTSFRRHHTVDLDTPAFHILLHPLLPILRPILAAFYAIRWQLSRPLQIRLLPKWMTDNIPGLHSLKFITYGEMILTIPLAILMLAGYYTCFVSPDVEQSGEIASYAIVATFLTANKTNSIASFLFGISFERMIPFHKLSSLCAVLLSFGHGYVAYAHGDTGSGDGSGGLFGGGNGGSDDRRHLSSDESQFGLTGPNPNLVKFAMDGDTNTSGSLLTLSMALLVLLSLFPILRRKFFDFWFWTHIALSVCVIMFCLLHEVTTVIFVALWWAVDLMMRYVVMAGCRYPRKATLTKVLPDVVEISFAKPSNFNYNPGQFVQLSVLELGVLSFHPISISSSPHEPMVTLHVRALGRWSTNLVELANTKEEVTVFIEGPYGCLSVDVDDDKRYEMALCVSGGIGVTHCQSVAKSLLHDHTQGRQLKQLRFVWVMRELNMIHLMSTPLESLSGAYPVDIELGQVNGTNQERRLRSVTTDVFVTKSNPDIQQNSYLDASDPRNLHFGRPNIDAIVSEVARDAQAQGVSHVAVFGCGPKALVDSLQEACRRHSKSLTDSDGVTFDVHEEIFDF